MVVGEQGLCWCWCWCAVRLYVGVELEAKWCESSVRMWKFARRWKRWWSSGGAEGPECVDRCWLVKCRSSNPVCVHHRWLWTCGASHLHLLHPPTTTPTPKGKRWRETWKSDSWRVDAISKFDAVYIPNTINSTHRVTWTSYTNHSNHIFTLTSQHPMSHPTSRPPLSCGIDIGTTTVKCVLVRPVRLENRDTRSRCRCRCQCRCRCVRESRARAMQRLDILYASRASSSPLHTEISHHPTLLPHHTRCGRDSLAFVATSCLHWDTQS